LRRPIRVRAVPASGMGQCLTGLDLKEARMLLLCLLNA